MKNPNRLETDVLIIGGGATGTSIMRDCSLRGIDCILVERDDLASGTTGRNHGLLHSGARYAVKDQHSAKECIHENLILKKIAKHCVEDTSGLFITLPEDELSFQENFIDSCEQAGIETKQLTPEEALLLEPNTNPNLIGAVQVPDGTIDPFRLCCANVLDAKAHGAILLSHMSVTSLIKNQDTILGAICFDHKKNEYVEIHAKQVVNAAGIWGQKICEYADVKIKMFPAKGSLLILDYRINNLVLNRCRAPADADILVPGDSISLIGTTSTHVEHSEVDKLTVTQEEIEILLSEGEKLSPIMAKTRILRAYAGVRPLVQSDEGGSGRNISRGIVLLDHETRDGLKGFVTITGGKLMTCRLMAEQATDLIASKLGITTPCITHTKPLPGSDDLIDAPKKSTNLSNAVYQNALYRHGKIASKFLSDEPKNQAIICECEMVTAGEIKYAIEELDTDNITDLRRRTRLGMGPCQGELCSYRAASLFCEYAKIDGNKSSRLLTDFLQERWKGVKPILWGDAMRESEFSYWIYEGLFGASQIPQKEDPRDFESLSIDEESENEI